MFDATQADREARRADKTNVCNQEVPPAALQSAPPHQCDDAKDPFVPQNVPMTAVARAAFKSSFSVL